MMTPEGRVKAKLKKILGGAYQFWPVQTGYGAATVDVLACIVGRFWGIECKAPGKKPTPRQLTTMKQIRAAGGRTFWVTIDVKGDLLWYEVND